MEASFFVSVKLSGFFPHNIWRVSGGYVPGITWVSWEKKKKVKSNAQSFDYVKPTGKSFMEIRDSSSSSLEVPLLCKALGPGALPDTFWLKIVD
jgi:hypothetical protein